MKKILTLIALLIAVNVFYVKADHTDNLNSVGTFTFSGVIFTPCPACQDRETLVVANGFQIDNATYTMSGGNPINAFTQFETIYGSGGNYALPYPLGPGSYVDLFSVDFSTGTNWTLTITVAAQCISPSISNINASANPVCSGSSSTLTVSGSLGSGTNWYWYSGSCGGTLLGNGNTLSVSPTTPTTYYVRGEGGCLTPQPCSSITVSVAAVPVPTITAGGPTSFCNGGSVTLSTPVVTGNAFGFTGGSRVNISNGPAASNFTIEAWVNLSDYGNNGYETVYAFSDGSYGLYITGGQLDLYLSNGDNMGVSVLPLNQWHHIAVTYNGSTFTYYIDGVVDNTISLGGQSLFSGSVSIGADDFPDQYDGYMDEIRIWNTNLSQGTIQSWMNQYVTNAHPNYANMLSYYKFDETSGSTTADATGNGHTGTLANNPTHMIPSTIPFNALSFLWSPGGATTSSISATTAGNYTVAVTNGAGCTGTSSATVVSIYPAPTPTITPNGPTNFCTGGSVILDAGLYQSYSWNTTETTESITVSTTNNYVVTVTDNNGCTGTGSQSVNVSPIPTATISYPGSPFCGSGTESVTQTGQGGGTYSSTTGLSINSANGDINIGLSTPGNYIVTYTFSNGSCGSSTTTSVTISGYPSQPGAISGNTVICPNSTQTYSIAPVTGAVNYTWTLPSGWSGSSTDVSITLTAGNSGGTISVTANNLCGSSPAQTLAVTVGSGLSQPGAISGASPVCSGGTGTYSISAVSGATSYTWTLPSGWTGSSTTTSINTTIGPNSGNITVTASNSCGTSTPSILAVIVTSSVPAQPGLISGTINPCYGTSQTYSVSPVAGATNYVWTTPIGWTGASSTNSITVTVGNSSGNITVKASNVCGNSPSQSLASGTIGHAPAQPATITGSNSVCSGSTQTYSIASVAGATSYLWTLPSGWSGSSTSTSITVTVGAAGGNVIVKAVNSCGSGPGKTLFVSLITVTPVTISGNPGNYNFCSQTAPTSQILIASSGYSSYSWSPSGGNSQTATVNTANTYIVTATNGLGCTTTASKMVTNNCALPTSLNTTNITGTSATANWIQSQCRVNYTIQISVHNLNSWTQYTISPNNNYTFTGLALSTFYDWQIKTNCNTAGTINSGWSPIQTFTTGAFRMEAEGNSGLTFNIYPNPAESFVTVSFSAMNEGTYNINLIDMTGRIVKSEIGKATNGENSHIMNLDGVAKGMYMILLQKGDDLFKSKLVVE